MPGPSLRSRAYSVLSCVVFGLSALIGTSASGPPAAAGAQDPSQSTAQDPIAQIVTCPDEDDGFEPNNSRTEATVITSHFSESLVACDDDWFSIDVATGQDIYVDVAFTHADGDLDLELYDGAGLLVDSSNSAEDFESIAFHASDAQTFHVRVFGVEGAQNGYQLGVTLSDLPLSCPNDDGFEPNDSLADAYPLGETTFHAFEAIACDDDWYSIDLFAGQELSATIIFVHSNGDLDLELYDAGGALIVSSSVSSDTNDEEVLNHTAGETATVYVRVFGVGGAQTVYQPTFNLSPLPLTCPDDDAYEPNDSLGEAYVLSNGDYIDAIACDGDNDFYSIEAAAGQQVQSRMYRNSPDGVIELYDGAGVLLATSTEVGGVQEVRHLASEDGTFHLRVTGITEEDRRYSLWAIATEVPDVAVPSPFVGRVGTELTLEGQPYTMRGLNVYNANSHGWCGPAMNTGTVLADALAAHGERKNVIRAWFFQPLAQSTPDDPVQKRTWEAFDNTLAVADAHGMKVIATLTDQWGECGDGGTNGFKTQEWYESGYQQAQPGMLVSYRDYVQEVVSRYKNDPRIAFWQLINEAEVAPAVGECPAGDQQAVILKTWAANMSALVKSIDPHHLVSLGTIGGGQCGTQGDQYFDVHDLPHIDLCEYHDYSPTEPMPGDEWDGLQVRLDQCAALGKPLFVGEVGIIPNLVGGTLKDRAEALLAKLEVQSVAGVQGFLAWAWMPDGEDPAASYDIGPGDPLLDVLMVNRPPEQQGGLAGEVAQGTPVRFDATALFSDPDGDSLYLRDVTQPANGTVSCDLTGCWYTSDPDHLGEDMYSYVVADGKGGTAAATQSVWVVESPPDPDADGDGVDDSIGLGGGAFDDGQTHGSIVDTGGYDVLVAPDPDGVRITVTDTGTGAGSAVLTICGFTMQLAPGSEVVVTCGSITVHVGYGEAQIVLGDGVTVITVPARVTALVDENPDGSYRIEHLGGESAIGVTVDGIPTTIEPDQWLTVEAWQFIGFAAPIDNDGVLNGAKAGQTVPLKWRLLDGAGEPVSDLGAVTVQVRSLGCGAGESADLPEEMDVGATGFQNLGEGYYQFNWKTPKSYASSCKTLILEIGDGVLHTALFEFTR